MGKVKSDIEIAREAKMKPIQEVLNGLNVPDKADVYSPIGRYIAKIKSEYLETLKNKKDFDQISRMAGEEKEHLDYFNELAKKESIKPTKLSNLFGVGAFAMGIGTALLGRKAAYVCTEAVEEVIEAHYQKQIDEQVMEI